MGTVPTEEGRLLRVIGRSLLLATVVLVFTAGAFLFSSVPFDDPYITFRYARHLAQGFGPLWNIDEPPVEGYTSTAWMLWAAGAEWLGVPAMLAARLTGFGAAVVTLCLAVFAARGLFRDWVGSASLALLIALSADVCLYAVSGMENAVAVPLVVLLLVLIDGVLRQPSSRRAAVAAAVVSALCWLRPEAHLILVVAVVAVFRPLWRPILPLRVVVVFAAVCAVAIAPLHLGRLSYFGSLVPNTYYAKHDGGHWTWALVSGLQYLAEVLRYYGLFFVLPVVAFLGRNELWRNPLRAFVLLLSAGWLAFIVKVGGDDTSAFPGVRLALPVLPVVFLASLWSIEGFIESPWRRRVAMAGLCVVLAILQVPRYWEAGRAIAGGNNLGQPSLGSLGGVLIGRFQEWTSPNVLDGSAYLKSHTPVGEAIAIPWAGRISYETDLKVIDLLGLNDRHIARLEKRQRGIDVKYDADYVLNRKPFFICENFGPFPGLVVDDIARMSDLELHRLGAWKVGQRELLRNPALRQEYRISEAPVSGTCFQRIAALAR